MGVGVGRGRALHVGEQGVPQVLAAELVGGHGVEEPHLVAGSAGGDVEAPFVVAAGRGDDVAAVDDHRQQDDVALVALEFFEGADLDVVAFSGRHVDALVDKILYESCLVALAQDDDAHGAVGIGGVLCEPVELVDDRLCFWSVDQLVPASFAVALGNVDRFQWGGAGPSRADAAG